jgi:predicted nucleotidyltransferase
MQYHRRGSDIDILVGFRGNIDAFAFIRLAHELQDLF